MRRIALGLIFFCAAAGNLLFAAPAEKVSARAETAKGTVTIGEPIECKVTVRFDKSTEIISGIPEPESRGLELKSSQDFHDREGKMRILGRTFQFTAFQLGNYMIGSLEISYRTSGGEIKTIKTNPLYITVKSVAEGEEKTDIRDVKGVVKLPYAVKKYLTAAGVFIFLSLLALYLLIFRKKEKSGPADPDAHLTPSEIALRDLHELFDSSLIRDGRVKQYYLKFSEILRFFLEKQFGIAASEATTSEIEYVLLRRIDSIPDDLKKKLLETLKSADYAKFAKWVPPPSDVLALNKQAEAIVRDLTSSQGESHAVS